MRVLTDDSVGWTATSGCPKLGKVSSGWEEQRYEYDTYRVVDTFRSVAWIFSSRRVKR